MKTKNKNALSAISSTIPPFARLLLLFSFSINKSSLFILAAIIPKYLPVFIIINYFTRKLDDNTKNNFYVSFNLRKAELIILLPYLDYSFYF